MKCAKSIQYVIDNSNLTIVSYVDTEGYPVSKAMLQPRKQEGFETFYFSTNTSSNKVTCFKNNPLASIYFTSKRYFKGVSFSGTIEVIEDDEVKNKLWREGDELYYSEGVLDPDYCILKFVTKKCRYYSNFNSRDFSLSQLNDDESDH